MFAYGFVGCPRQFTHFSFRALPSLHQMIVNEVEGRFNSEASSFTVVHYTLLQLLKLDWSQYLPGIECNGSKETLHCTVYRCDSGLVSHVRRIS